MASPSSGDDDVGDEHLFDGVRFLLLGFDEATESQYRSEMVRCGGVDAGRLGSGCTHVVVRGLFYDDPMCVAARTEGKKVVSEQWVEDSLDRGVLADADKVIYWPVRDSNGIPGAGSLLICLTGYERKYRDYITLQKKMVSLMGAQFSRPLVGNEVTHLICYKFEGEKYELAKRVNIKLVNHRWLEDCLKAWKILPVDNYNKSWELELMETRVNDSEDETEDANQSSFKSRSTARGTSNSKGCAETSVNPDVNAPTHSPICPGRNKEVFVERHLNTPDHMKAEEGSKPDDIKAQTIPNSSLLAVSAKANDFAPIQTPYVLSGERESAVVRNINSPNAIQEAKEKYVGGKTPGTTSGEPVTPSSSKMTVSGNYHLHSLNRTPTTLHGKTDLVSGKYLVSHNQVNFSKANLTSPSRGDLSVNQIYSSKADGEQHKDELSGSLAAASQSNVCDKLANHESGPNSGGASTSKNTSDPSSSKKASQKSFSPEGRSVHKLASPQSVEERRAGSSISSLGMGEQKVIAHAKIRSIKGNEIMKNVDVLNGAYSQKKKSLASPARLKVQKGDLVSETDLIDCTVVSRLSDTSEPASVSFTVTNSAEANVADLGKQQSLYPGKQSKSRKTSLKHGGPVNGMKSSEYSSSDKNVKSLSKSRTLHKAMSENKCAVSPSVTSQDGKTSPGFSIENKGREAARASGNAVNKDCRLHETGNACTKNQAQDTSVHRSQVSCYGNADTKIADAPDVNNNEVAIALNFEPEMLVSDANVEVGTKRFQDTSCNVPGETSYSKQESVPIESSAGGKRPRSTSMEADGLIAKSGKKAVSGSRPAEIFSCEHAESSSKIGCTNASAVEFKTPTKKVPICDVRNTMAKRTRSAHTTMEDAQSAPNLEFSKVISQENIEKSPRKLCDSANADEHQRKSPKKLPNTRVRNTTAKRSRKFEAVMNSETLVDKTETIVAGSLFDDLFSSDDVEDCTNKLSSSASASECGSGTPYPKKNVPTARVRNAVAKRKIEAVESKLGSKCGKVGNAIASVGKAISSNRIEKTSCNVDKLTAGQDSKKANKDVMGDVSGLFCQDSVTVDKSEALNNLKLRSSKRNKVVISDHEKENIQDHNNLKSKSKVGNGNLYSKFKEKSMHKSTDVLSECQRVRGNECGTLVTSKPALFILSGNCHRRREYRSMLRHLKGRVCRDSHNWSYKATHFIAPDPLKRTEKFFAAAAAGRWIIKTDYLTSCTEVGKLLDEEPFEWFGTGLSDGEKISLEAPRKWRILRQQMGHGAFYGMQIIVYGQLILPKLDTLKRAVRAGDGTILATSPPYTRFLNSGVDFAVVSAGMPSADSWVQEFIRHNIPCVSADYLVEYVCKPGHPLDKHVLFKTNDLAKKSLEKLIKNQQVVAADDPELSEDEDDPENLTCSVCGRKDREEVMLICGDEDGKIGCGIGMHIDCCDPPLEAVPEDDWLCPKCEAPKASKTKNTRGITLKIRASKLR
ncbi:hypothetical protein ACP4OV_004824 [Aristida adscensionis]